MKTVFQLSLLLCLVAVAEPQGPAPSGTEQARILGMESAWNQAVQQKDVRALELLLGPELVYVETDGELLSREQYIAKVGNRSRQRLQVMNEVVSVRVYGVLAVATGIYREKGLQDGKPYLRRERFTDTWLNQNGNWICVASQSTRIN